MIVDYQDRDGKSESVTEGIKIFQGDTDRFDNPGIRKAVLLSRYADLLKAWTTDERRSLAQSGQIPTEGQAAGVVVMPCITRGTGIIARCIFQLGQWERQSAPLRVSANYKPLFKDFADYFSKEMAAIGDSALQQELDLLHTLADHQSVTAGLE